MGALAQTAIDLNQRFTLEKAQIGMLRRQMRDLNTDEFNQFIATAIALNLNPLARQITAAVFSKNDKEKRSMSIMVTIMGFRALAQRSGNYRPDPNPPVFDTDPSLKGDANPQGLVSCTVSPQIYAHGEWSPVPETVFWDEIAPIYKGRLDYKSPYFKRPRGQLAKSAEAAALRKGWPEDLSNIYSEDEMERPILLDEATPAMIADQADRERRLELVGGSDQYSFFINGAMENIRGGDVHDRISSILRDLKDKPTEAMDFVEANRATLRLFHASHKLDAQNIKKQVEAIQQQTVRAG